jgi:hypothetical protein
MRKASVLYTFFLEDFWTQVGLKVLFNFSNTEEVFLVFDVSLFHFHGKFDNQELTEILHKTGDVPSWILIIWKYSFLHAFEVVI